MSAHINPDKHMNSNIRNLMSGDEEMRENIAPSSLLTFNRLDVVIKYLFAKSVINNTDTRFFEKLYLRHIQDINGFVESDDTNKIGSADFLKSFKGMIASAIDMRASEKYLLPVNENGQILDGAHRLSIALALGMENIDTVLVDAQRQIYDYKFFKSGSLSEIELDLVVHEYCKIKTETKGVLIWPIAKSKDFDPLHFLERHGKIIYAKQVKLDFTGLMQLIRVAYRDESWVGSAENDFQGTRNKARWCSKDGNNLTFIIIEPDDGVDMVAIKQFLREFYNLDKHSMHINDHASDTLELCELLLNENSINWLNTSNLVEFEQFEEYLKLYKEAISTNKMCGDDFIVLGSLFATFGIKDSSDLDYVNSNLRPLNLDSDKLELDLGKLKWINKKAGELTSNPQCYYYYNGLKFLSVKETYEFKSKRRRNQDVEDLVILDLLKHRQKYHASARINLEKLTRFSFYLIKAKQFAYFVRFVLYRILAYIGNVRS